MPVMAISALFLSLTILGFSISSYFTLLAYRWIEPTASWIPSFCQLGEESCASIIFTPRARLFRVPNSLLGQVFYLALGAGALGDILFLPPFFYGYLAASFLTVMVGAFLTYSLLFITRIPCGLCLTSHALNLLIFAALLLARPG